MFYEKAGMIVTEINWTAPTEREDGSIYDAPQHAGYELGTSDPTDSNDGFVPWVSVPAAYAITNWDSDMLNLVEGDNEVALRTVDLGGRTSVWSIPTVFTGVIANPNAPTGFVVL